MPFGCAGVGNCNVAQRSLLKMLELVPSYTELCTFLVLTAHRARALLALKTMFTKENKALSPEKTGESSTFPAH